MDPNCGLPDIIGYLNLWAREADRVEKLLIVRYEDMRSDPNKALRRIMEFIDEDAADSSAVEGAVEYSSVENMRKLEEKNVFWFAGGRMKPGKKGDPNTCKVRRAKVDGYRDYFDDAGRAEIDELVNHDLSPIYGYEAPPEPDRAANG